MIQQLTDEEKYHLNIYHKTDDDYCKKQLDSLYGLVNQDQDKTIIKHIYGKKVLDVGAGNGSLSRRLIDAGFEVTSIEPHEPTRKLAKQWYGVDELPFDIYDTPFDDYSFDTVILRECVEHLDFVMAMQEINRVCSKRVLIFQTNLNPYVGFARLRVRHAEYNPQTLKYYQHKLKRCHFPNQKVTYRDVLAFPLSGGYQHRQLCPRNKMIEESVLKLDRNVTKLLEYTKLLRLFGWRYVLTADRETYRYVGRTMIK